LIRTRKPRRFGPSSRKKIAFSGPFPVNIAHVFPASRTDAAAMARILLLNGPNLNLLGTREPAVYGTTTLGDIERKLGQLARDHGHELIAAQSNAEHELIGRVQAAKAEAVAFVIINPGAFTHTSIALRDAFLAVSLPFIEVHLSNIFAREEFRHRSYLSGLAVGCVMGFGPIGYELAMAAACARLAA
jgi:3-dehydroquinate dehydratase II